MRTNGRLDGLIVFVVFLSSLFLSLSALAESEAAYSVGDVIPGLELANQHEEAGAVDVSTRILLFSRDMDGGKLLQAALANSEAGYLEENDIVYVSDISGMPSLVARLFALPKMRKRPYPMLLDHTGDATRRLPDVDERATVIFLQELRIDRIEHVETANAVRALLGLDPLPEE